MAFWLLKSEPFKFSLDDLKSCPDSTDSWDGIRNYQARNFMRDEMKVGDRVLFYHSRVDPPAVVGTAVVVKEAYPDHTAWDPKSDYYDPKASPENPRWIMVDVKWESEFVKEVTLAELKAEADLEGMLVTKKGQRLSIQPVEEAHFDKVLEMGGVK